MDMVKVENFKRVASRRVNNILEGIRILGNCSRRETYAYTEADVKKIFNTIKKQLKTVESKFEETKQFELKEGHVQK